MSFETGQIVKHKALPELGRARVEGVYGENIHLTFETATGGESKVFRLPNEHIEVAKDQSPSGFPQARTAKADATKKKKKAAAVKAPKAPKGWSFDEAWKRFSDKYSGGFSDPKYVKDEREYKLAAVARWNEEFGAAGLGKLKASGDPSEVAKAVSRAYQGLSLLHPIEWTKFREALKLSPASLPLMQEYAAAVTEGGISEERFERLLKCFDDMGLGRGKWTLLTLWPFLAAFKGFVFIKPEITKAAAEGLNLALNYSPTPNFQTYQRALELYEKLWSQLEPKGAQDWVDVQSFIWVGWS